jgi:hypothetical protein
VWCSDGYAVGAGSFSYVDGGSVANCDAVLHAHRNSNSDADGYRDGDSNIYTVPDSRSANRDGNRDRDRYSYGDTNRDRDADTVPRRPMAWFSGFPRPS